MNIRLNWTEGEIKEAMRALEDRAEKTPPEDLERLLVLSRMHADLRIAAEECLARDILAIRQEYGL